MSTKPRISVAVGNVHLEPDAPLSSQLPDYMARLKELMTRVETDPDKGVRYARRLSMWHQVTQIAKFATRNAPEEISNGWTSTISALAQELGLSSEDAMGVMEAVSADLEQFAKENGADIAQQVVTALADEEDGPKH
jgi:hypothetical protein